MKSELITFKPLAVVTGLTIFFLLPFINKAFHIDDTLFLWCAEQIQSYPFDFFGFTANWNGMDRPMYLINQNPPLVSYYIAFVTSLFGWSEVSLHAAFLAPAVFLSTGIYLLAAFFCAVPTLAAIIAVATPAFIVSATNVMCDILMVTFYVWAAVFWMYGIERDRIVFFFISSFLIALSALTKYFGISMVPLLLVYTLLNKRGVDIRLLFLAIPILILVGYQWLTLTLYDTSLLSNAATYALERGVAHSAEKLISKTMLGLSFSGGCLIILLFYSHLLWSRIYLSVGSLLVISMAAAFVMVDSFSENPLIDLSADPKLSIIQFGLFVLIGFQIISLAVTDVLKNKDAQSVFLLLWVLGTLFFSSHVNWTVNARTILPMIPAVGILAVRRLTDRHAFNGVRNMKSVFWPAIPGALIALIIAWGDASFAGCQRSIARYIASNLNNYRYNVWFQGHWGFQYYMQLHEVKALDYKNSLIGTGDIIIIPKTNTGQLKLPLDKFTFVRKLECETVTWISTMSAKNNSGFYSDTQGKRYLPFAFGNIEPEEYYVFIVGKFKNPGQYIKHLNGDI